MRRPLYLLASLSFTIFSCQQAPKKALNVHTLFTDGTVLQRNSVSPVWGEFTAGGTVTIEASWGERVSGSADVEGQWQLQIPTPDAGGPFEMTIATSDSVIKITNILSGEVWLASGQSNMQMPVKGWPPRDPILNSEEEIASADFSEIRMIAVPRATSIRPAISFEGKWLPATSENVGDFSATAYFFARELHQKLQVPIGIIHSSWGGTVAEAWASAEKLATLGDFDADLDKIGKPELIEESEAWFASRSGVPMPTNAEAWQAIDWSKSGATAMEVQNGWDEIVLPGVFDEVDSSGLDGAFWIRKQIDLSDAGGSFTLAIGAIDDMDMVYINGALIGATMEAGKYQEPRIYQVPDGLLQAGTNVISILAVDTGGPGAVSGTMTLTSSKGQSLSLEGGWIRRLAGERYGTKLYTYSQSEDLSARPRVVRIHQNTPTALYNGMINPLIPFNIKGAIWYQGESNVGRAEQYRRLFPAMITDWRERWGNDFPFYFVQIAPFNYNASTNLSPALRDAQRRTLTLPGTGMAVTLDIGQADNIHPGNKQDVGQRLALWAIAQDYGLDVVPSGPLFRTAEARDGAMIVSFDYTADGLVAASGGLASFEVAGSDAQFVAASATILGDQVWVSSPRVPSPQHVRYAYKDVSEASLFNSSGLPASSFTSEESLP